MPDTSPDRSKVIAFPESEISILDAYLRGLPSESTRRVYSRCIRSFDNYLGDRQLQTATRRDVEAYRSHLEELGRAPATVAKHLSALSGLFAFMLDEGEVERNPVSAARRPKLSDCSTRKGITKDETQALLAVCDPSTAIGLRG
jgi:integrase/recombinase XerD